MLGGNGVSQPNCCIRVGAAFSSLDLENAYSLFIKSDLDVVEVRSSG